MRLSSLPINFVNMLPTRKGTGKRSLPGEKIYDHFRSSSAVPSAAKRWSDTETLQAQSSKGYPAKENGPKNEHNVSNTFQKKSKIEAGILNSFGLEKRIENLERGWRDILQSEIQKEYFRKLETFLSCEYEKHDVFPKNDDVFTALDLCPFEKVKVVVLGQDPYHGPGQAHGLAFSVNPGVRPPPSLLNIFKEISDDEILKNDGVVIENWQNGDLRQWARKGVLLLNSVLTVRSGQANSHKLKGWEQITSSLIDALNRRNSGLVFLLWGNSAKVVGRKVDKSRHRVVASSHPSPLSAYRGTDAFIGSKCFSKVNKALEDLGQSPIDWSLKKDK